MTALTFWLALIVVQVPPMPRTFVETATFGDRAACEVFSQPYTPCAGGRRQGHRLQVPTPRCHR